jgi:MFS family permease
MHKRNQSAELEAGRVLFFVNTAIWLYLAAGMLVRMVGDSSGRMMLGVIISIMMFGNAVGMFVCGIVATRREKLFYYFTLFFLAVNIVLTFTDQFGFWDLITLIIDVVIVVLLIVGRKKLKHTALGSDRD